MSNPSMPGLLKIGKSDRDPTDFRAGELYSTGVPEPFKVEYFAYVDNHHDLERSIHRTFAEYRPNRSREFFRLNAANVIAEIRKQTSILHEKNFFVSEEKIAEQNRIRQQEKRNSEIRDQRLSDAEKIASNWFTYWKLKFTNEKVSLKFVDILLIGIIILFSLYLWELMGSLGVIIGLPIIIYAITVLPNSRKEIYANEVFTLKVKEHAVWVEMNHSASEAYLKSIYDGKNEIPSKSK